MPELPEMRASHLKSNVESLSELGAESDRAIRHAVADVVRTIEEASRVAWLPLELDVRLTEAVAAACGLESTKRWSSGAIVRSADGPLLRPLIHGLQAMGLTPATALKRAPYAWGLIYRGCGELRFEPEGEREIVLTQDDAPDAMLASRTYCEGIAGAFDGAVQIAGGRQPRSVVEIDPTLRCVRYRCRWD